MSYASADLADIVRLNALARAIRSGNETAEGLRQLAEAKLHEAVAESILVGSALNDAKIIVGKRAWASWCSEHLRGVTPESADRFMRMHRNPASAFRYLPKSDHHTQS